MLSGLRFRIIVVGVLIILALAVVAASTALDSTRGRELGAFVGVTVLGLLAFAGLWAFSVRPRVRRRERQDAIAARKLTEVYDHTIRPGREAARHAMDNGAWRYVQDLLQPGEQPINLGFLISNRFETDEQVYGVLFLTDHRVLWTFSEGGEMKQGWEKPHAAVMFLPQVAPTPGVRTMLPSEKAGFPSEITTFSATDRLGVPMVETLFRQIEDFALEAAKKSRDA